MTKLAESSETSPDPSLPPPPWAEPRKRRTRAARPPLDRGRIVATGLAIVDKDGAEALTVRRLADALGVSPMSIYWHVTDKAELLRLIGEGTAGWNQFFREGGAAPLDISYEELTHDLSGVVRRVLDWLDVRSSRTFDLSKLTMRKQADSLSDEWAERYRKLRPRISPYS